MALFLSFRIREVKVKWSDRFYPLCNLQFSMMKDKKNVIELGSQKTKRMLSYGRIRLLGCRIQFLS